MMNCCSMTTMRIWARSKKPEKWNYFKWVTKHNTDANDNMYDCVTLHDTNVNDHIHACVAPHDAHSTDHIHWASCAVSQVVFSFISAHTRTVAQDVWVPHPISIVIHVRSLRLDSPFLLLALPSAPFPLPRLHEVYGKPAQLRQGGCGLHWQVPHPHILCLMFFSPGLHFEWSPICRHSSWYALRKVSPVGIQNACNCAF